MWFSQYHERTDIPDIPKSEAYKNNLHTVTYFVMVGMHWDITAKDFLTLPPSTSPLSAAACSVALFFVVENYERIQVG